MKQLLKAIEKTLPKGNTDFLTHIVNCEGHVTDTYSMFRYPDMRADGTYEGKKLSPKKFPDPKRVFPSVAAVSAATVSVNEVLSALRFLGASMGRNGDTFTVEFRENEIVFSAKNEETGLYAENVSQEISIDGVPVPMNPCKFHLSGEKTKRFFAFLKREKIEHCLVEFFGKAFPVLFSANEYQYLLMPNNI